MGEHYPECEEYITGDGLPCICELLSAHADKMQAAEHERLRAEIQKTLESYETKRRRYDRQADAGDETAIFERDRAITEAWVCRGILGRGF